MGIGRSETLEPYLRRAYAWRRASVNRRIFAAMATVAAAGVLIKAAAMARDVVVASYFGTSDAVDAFFIALTVPTFAINIITGSLPAALVPAYVRVTRAEGAEGARRLVSGIFVGTVALVAVASLVLVLGAPLLLPLIGGNFGGDKLALTRHLFYFLLPAVLLAGLSGILSSLLNAHERFLLAAMTPLFGPVLTIGLLLAAGARWGVYLLAVGLLAGAVAELLVLGWSAYRRGLLAPARWTGWHPETRRVLEQYVPVVVGGAVMGSSPLIDQSMAASLGAGSVATLGYGSKVVAAALGVGTTALSTAIFPHLSSMVAAADWAGVRHTLRTYVRLVLGVSILAVLLIVALSTPIVRLLYERGAFSSDDTLAVARVQALLALQIPFFALGIIAVRLLSALRGNRVLMWVSIMNFVTNIAGNYVFMRVWGVAGIALSTSVVYAISAIVLCWSVQRRIGHWSRSGQTTQVQQSSNT